MKQLIHKEHYQPLLVEAVPLLDVRSPGEFKKGAIPGAVNLPLLSDKERSAVGKEFKQFGQEAAVTLGYKLVSDEVKEQRINEWVAFLKDNPYAFLYCFRGGLRSQIAQEWLTEAGYPVQRIAGGYKALRRFLIDSINLAASECEFLLIAGRTGVGKTQLLSQFENHIDLEGLANHRGSAFGTRSGGQPTQINFENALAISLLKLPFSDFRRLVLEDESRAIGSLSIPLEFSNAMLKAPIAVIEEPGDYRVNTILNDYIVANFSEFKKENEETAESRFSEYLLDSLLRIRKRLGEALYEEILQDINAALQSHLQQGSVEPHKAWIKKLLENYYDPMYEYQLNKKLKRIVFRGDSDEFIRWSAGVDYTSDQAHS